VDEIWKAVVGYEGLYEVSDHGNIRRLPTIVQGRNRWGDMIIHRRGRIIKLHRAKSTGYIYFTASKDGVHVTLTVHSCVAEAFFGERPSQNHDVNHINGIRHEAHLSNLEWVTKSQNHLHAYRVIGRRLGRTRAVLMVDSTTGKQFEFQTIKGAAKLLGISRWGIFDRLKSGVEFHGFMWKYRDAWIPPAERKAAA
jgi:hypothetical protein